MTTLHNNPQPFDLNRALNGEPVLLRNGNKAFVKFQLNKPDNNVLVGYIRDGKVDNICEWWLDGTEYLHVQISVIRAASAVKIGEIEKNAFSTV